MDLSAIKNQAWFYEFELPDGTVTPTRLPSEIRLIHTSRREKLRRVIRDFVGDATRLSALDIASHEGYFTVELAQHFGAVHGIEIRPESMASAKLIVSALGLTNVRFTLTDFLQMKFDASLQADFVLLYGLLYHLENPVQALRLASQLARKHILIETQVFPYDMTGRLEDGHYTNQREVHGVFSLSMDYPSAAEGGSTRIALVPSLNALVFLMREFGFRDVKLIKPDNDDYEQFRRGSRVIVYGQK